MTFWRYHDRLLDTCNLEARKLTIEITHAVNRLEAGPRWASLHGEALGVTNAEKQATLQRAQQLIRIAYSLCSWVGTRGTCHRAPSPFDTEAAMYSPYGQALGLQGQTQVSPMRALWQLERALLQSRAHVKNV